MLQNRIALVTGAAQGIGEVIAREFANQEATLILVDVNKDVHQLSSELNDVKPLKHSSHICDISNSDQVKQLFNEIKQVHNGRVPNIIVNNAGVYLNSPVESILEKNYDRLMDINVKGTFLVTQAAVKELIEQYQTNGANRDPKESYASIISIASLSGKNGCEYENVYSATKSALEGLTRSLAKELGKYRIRCNAVLPGLIRTKMLTSEERKAFVAKLAAMTSLKRVGEPEEVAQTCLFLASEMSSYITGASIDINGGLAF